MSRPFFSSITRPRCVCAKITHTSCYLCLLCGMIASLNNIVTKRPLFYVVLQVLNQKPTVNIILLGLCLQSDPGLLVKQDLGWGDRLDCNQHTRHSLPFNALPIEGESTVGLSNERPSLPSVFGLL